jgi:hypothetical protein
MQHDRAHERQCRSVSVSTVPSMRKPLVCFVAVLAIVAFALTGIATAKKKLPNCAASVARNCAPPTEAQIRLHPDARHDAVTACTRVNLLVAQTHLNEAADASSLADAIAELSRTKRHGPLAPMKLLSRAKAATTASAQLIALTGVQAWCGDFGVPA